MKRLILIVFGIALVLNTPVAAQQAGENINVLPVVPQNIPDWEIKGDGYLQRQVEPTIAASTRNPDHLLAFFNDYRAVDVPDDLYVGEDQFQVAALTLKVSEFMLAGIIPKHGIPIVETPPTAAAEAWVGMSRSYDGGLTWAGGFLPGALFDDSVASLASPVYGLEAATDPVLAPAPCGYFYVVFVAFTRGGQSKLAVARYQDLNNDEGGDTIKYLGTTVLETGNNADNGHFLDKPDIEVDVWRGDGGPEECGHRVYVSYSTFVGLDKYQKFQSKVNFAKSEDFGLTYSIEKINKTWNQNQGSTIAIDPGVGEPDNKGGPGTIYVAWRHFFNPDAIIVRKSINYGVSWATPVVVSDPAMMPFDQPTISTGSGLSSYLAFRSNGFPTAAVTDQSKVFVAWQERVGGNDSPRIVLTRSDDDGKNWTAPQAVDNTAYLKPYNAGAGGAWQNIERGPQVMPKLSFGGGRLMLAYYESRGLMSSVIDSQDTFDGLKDVVDYYDLTGPQPGYITGYNRVVDFRAALLDPGTGALLGNSSSIQVSRYPIKATAILGDGQQLEDVAYVAPCDPDQDLGPSNPPCARQVNRVNAPTSAGGTSPFIGDYPDLVPMLQFVIEPDLNNPNYGQWRWATEAADVPYQGFHAIFTDNRHIVPPHEYPGTDEWLGYSNYGPPGIGGACTNAGSRNSDVLTSRVTADMVVNTPTTYKTVGSASRSFPFSVNNRKDTPQIFFLEVDEHSDPASFSPASFVESGYIKVFPYSTVSQALYVDNAAQDDVFRIGIYDANCSDPEAPLIEGNCSINCLEKQDCRLGTATFNADQTNAEIGLVNLGDTETENQNPFVLNPFVLNPFVLNYSPENPFVLNQNKTNISPSNPFVLNPFVLNPFVLNSAPSDENNLLKAGVMDENAVNAYDVIDTTWVVQTDELNNTASTQLPVINVDNAEQYKGNYAFQLIVHKASGHAAYRHMEDEGGHLYVELDEWGDPVYDNGVLQTSYDPNDGPPYCEAYTVEQDQILSNVYQDPNAENPFVLNPFVLNPFVLNTGTSNPFVLNPFVLNSTFTMAPPDDAVASTTNPALKTGSLNDGTTKDDRAPNEVRITLRAYRLKPFCEGDNDDTCIEPDEELIYDPLIDPPSAAVASMKCVQEALYGNNPEIPDPIAAAAACFDTKAPDLIAEILPGAPQPTIFPVGIDVPFPVNGWVLRNQGLGLAWAENAILRHGFILSTDEYLGLPDDAFVGQSIVDAESNPAGSSFDFAEGDLRFAYVESTNNPLAPHLDPVVDPLIEPFFVSVTDATVFPTPGGLDDFAQGDIILVTLAKSDNNDSIVADTVEIVDLMTLPGTNQIRGSFDQAFDDGFELYTFGEETFEAAILNVPDYVAGGTYYLFFFIDDFKEVSEYNDNNNVMMWQVEVVKPNQAPTFAVATELQAITVDEDYETIGGDIGEHIYAEWATLMDDGDGGTQELTAFVISPDPDPALFAEGPAVDVSTGDLTFTTMPNAYGSGLFSVVLMDDGGTENGGQNTSAAVNLTISVDPINDLPVVTVEIVAEDQTFVEGDTVSFSATVSDIEDGENSYATAVWDFGDGTTAENNLIPSHPYTDDNEDDLYSVTLTVTDENGDIGVGTVDVTVVNAPPTADAGGPYETLLFEPILLNGLGSSDIGADDLFYDWDFDNDGEFLDATGPTPSYGATAEGEFIIGLKVTDDDGDFDTASTFVTVIDPIPDWVFIGLLSPWKPSYSMELGSVLPMKWYYTLDGVYVNSSMADPLIEVYRLADCNDGGEVGPVPVFSEAYGSGSDDWQGVSDWHYNLDTDRPAVFEVGCYNIYVTTQYIGEITIPFRIRLK